LHHPWSVNETKIPWFSDDAHFSTPVNIKVTGRRLDGDAAPPESEGPNIAQARRGDPFAGPGGIDFMGSSMKFPIPGCGEITARMNDTELRFVTYVKR
jgi:hypothetical protein